MTRASHRAFDRVIGVYLVNGKYRLIYSEQGRRRILYFADKAEADTRAAQLQAALAAGKPQPEGKIRATRISKREKDAQQDAAKVLVDVPTTADIAIEVIKASQALREAPSQVEREERLKTLKAVTQMASSMRNYVRPPDPPPEKAPSAMSAAELAAELRQAADELERQVREGVLS